MITYQLDYAAGRPQMYDYISREQKAKRIIKVLEEVLGKTNLKNLSVFDLGCSTGIIDNSLAKRFKLVVGGDIDKDALEFAKKNFKKTNLKFRFEDAMNLSFKDNSFDVVICTHIYEHVPNPKKVFNEIKRILKPKGVCYFAAVNKFWPLEPHYNLLFLSYLPKKLADMYIKLSRKGKIYYESPKTYWELKELTKSFEIIEYTEKILKNPNKFGFENIPTFIGIFTLILKYFVPTFFWILVKRG
mgnify:CR=1 FL=1